MMSKEWNKTLTFLSMAHAKLSPSAAKIWMACPGMPSLLSSMNVEYKVGIPAATGTLVHEMVETLLKGRLNNLTLEEYYLDSTHHIDDFDITVDQEMVDCAHVYVDYIKRRSEELNVKRPLIEERVNMVEIHDQLWGTADAILIGENIIEVVDLKAGKWAVEPDSPQLKIYALGALSRYGNAECTVQMTIVQPRGWHKDGIIRSYSTSAANLVDWAYETLKPAAEACFEEIPTYNYSKDGCRWCNAKDICETYKLNQKGE